MLKDKPASIVGLQTSGFWKKIIRFFLEFISAFRIVFFIIYFSTCIFRFWVAFFSFFLSVINLLVQFFTVPLRILSGFPNHHRKENTTTLWNIQTEIYLGIGEAIVSVFLKRLQAIWEAMSLFFAMTAGRKIVALAMSFLFIVIPFGYLIPRPNDVYITESNSLSDKGRYLVQPGYLIIGHDLNDPEHTRAYRNEDVWWLLKFNSQGLKSKITTGKKYRVYVIGFRIYAPVDLYPNIISVTEIGDGSGG